MSQQMLRAMAMMMAYQSTAATDPYFANVVLLSHLDTLVSTVGYNPTEIGDAVLSTPAKFGSNSGHFGGAGALSFGSTQVALGAYFTVEFFIYRTAAVASTICTIGNQVAGASQIVAQVSSLGILTPYLSKNSGSYSSSAHSVAIPLNQWMHIVLEQDGTNMLTGINGIVEITNPASDAGGFTSVDVPLVIGARYAGGSYSENFSGYIDELRITEGVARYTADFTPPTQAFPDS